LVTQPGPRDDASHAPDVVDESSDFVYLFAAADVCQRPKVHVPADRALFADGFGGAELRWSMAVALSGIRSSPTDGQPESRARVARELPEQAGSA
jgi:hypothetical protein